MTSIWWVERTCGMTLSITSRSCGRLLGQDEIMPVGGTAPTAAPARARPRPCALPAACPGWHANIQTTAGFQRASELSRISRGSSSFSTSASPIARLCNWSADEPRKQERIDRGMNWLLSEWQLPFKACGQTSMLCVACCRLDHPSRYRRIENGSHHRSHHTTRVPYLDKNVTPFAYGHGYVNGIKWRDNTSYKASCDGCPRVPIWSNPTIKFKGDPARYAGCGQRPGHPRAGRARVEVPLESGPRGRFWTIENCPGGVLSHLCLHSIAGCALAERLCARCLINQGQGEKRGAMRSQDFAQPIGAC